MLPLQPFVLECDGDAEGATDADGVAGAAFHGVGGIDVEDPERGFAEGGGVCSRNFYGVPNEVGSLRSR